MADDGGGEASVPVEGTASDQGDSELGTSMKRQLDFVGSLLQGKSLLSHGGTWTAEAREPDRRQKLLEQLKLARKLRAKLEHAADVAEQSSQDDARNLLLLHAPDVSALACLTEAVRGKYTLDSYDVYTRQSQQQEKRRQQQVERARAALDKHVEKMDQEAKAVEKKTSKRTAASTSPPKRTESAKKPKATKKKSVKKAVADRAKPPPRIPVHALMQTSRAGALAYSSQHYKDEPSRRTITTKSGRRSGATRQCHDCKSSTKSFLRCHYWLPDGSQCGKTFCRKCLENKYEGPFEDWDKASKQTDWHCPSCLGECRCQYCSDQRRAAFIQQAGGFGLN